MNSEDHEEEGDRLVEKKSAPSDLPTKSAQQR